MPVTTFGTDLYGKSAKASQAAQVKILANGLQPFGKPAQTVPERPRDEQAGANYHGDVATLWIQVRDGVVERIEQTTSIDQIATDPVVLRQRLNAWLCLAMSSIQQACQRIRVERGIVVEQQDVLTPCMRNHAVVADTESDVFLAGQDLDL